MPIRIKIAKTAAELDSLFKTRHTVFVEEEGYMSPHSDGRIVDRFDTYPTTANVVALVDKEVVGGIRLTEASEAGMPPDMFFDFSNYLPSNTGKRAGASQFCLRQTFRTQAYRIATNLMAIGAYWCIHRGISHVMASINPKIAKLTHRLGFEDLTAPFHDPTHDVEVLPQLWETAKLKDPFIPMIRRLGMHDYLENFDRAFFLKGERIIKFGDAGSTAYVVVAGEVSVDVPGNNASGPETVTLARLGPGELFGELALLTNRPRTTEVTARTDTDLMVLERRVFQQQLQNDPKRMHQVLEMIANRLANTVGFLNH